MRPIWEGGETLSEWKDRNGWSNHGLVTWKCCRYTIITTYLGNKQHYLNETIVKRTLELARTHGKGYVSGAPVFALMQPALFRRCRSFVVNLPCLRTLLPLELVLVNDRLNYVDMHASRNGRLQDGESELQRRSAYI